jgi:hypothetical protein
MIRGGSIRLILVTLPPLSLPLSPPPTPLSRAGFLRRKIEEVIGYLSLENDDRDRAKGKVISQLTG